MLATALVIGAMILGVQSVGCADEPAAGLREGWKWRTTIPAVKFNDRVVTRECRVMV